MLRRPANGNTTTLHELKQSRSMFFLGGFSLAWAENRRDQAL